LPTMKLFNGKLVVLVQSSTTAGSINLVVKGKTLRETNVQIKSTKQE
jgi:beta-galactosidase